MRATILFLGIVEGTEQTILILNFEFKKQKNTLFSRVHPTVFSEWQKPLLRTHPACKGSPTTISWPSCPSPTPQPRGAFKNKIVKMVSRLKPEESTWLATPAWTTLGAKPYFHDVGMWPILFALYKSRFLTTREQFCLMQELGTKWGASWGWKTHPRWWNAQFARWNWKSPKPTRNWQHTPPVNTESLWRNAFLGHQLLRPKWLRPYPEKVDPQAGKVVGLQRNSKKPNSPLIWTIY